MIVAGVVGQACASARHGPAACGHLGGQWAAARAAHVLQAGLHFHLMLHLHSRLHIDARSCYAANLHCFTYCGQQCAHSPTQVHNPHEGCSLQDCRRNHNTTFRAAFSSSCSARSRSCASVRCRGCCGGSDKPLGEGVCTRLALPGASAAGTEHPSKACRSNHLGLQLAIYGPQAYSYALSALRLPGRSEVSTSFGHAATSCGTVSCFRCNPGGKPLPAGAPPRFAGTASSLSDRGRTSSARPPGCADCCSEM